MITEFFLNILMNFILWIVRLMPYSPLGDWDAICIGCNSFFQSPSYVYFFNHVQVAFDFILSKIVKINAFVSLNQLLFILLIYILFVSFELVFKVAVFILRFIRG